MATPIKYNGQRYKEAILFFLKVPVTSSSHLQSQMGYEHPGSPAVHITTEEDAYHVSIRSLVDDQFSFWRGTVDNHLETSINGFFPKVVLLLPCDD